MQTLLPAPALVLLHAPVAHAEDGTPFLTGAGLSVGLLLAGTLLLGWLFTRRHSGAGSIQGQQCMPVDVMLEKIPLPAALLDAAGVIVMANAAFCSLVGARAEDIKGRAMLEFDPAWTADKGERVRSGTRPAASLEYETSLRSAVEDQEIPVRSSLSSVEDDGPARLLWCGQDLSEQKRLAEEILAYKRRLHATREAAEAASRMKSEFIANMNHEIRTPMNAIIGYAEMLAGSDLREKEQRFVEIISKSGMALVNILNDIMDLSKIEAGRVKITPSTVRLAALMHDVGDLFKGQIMTKKLTYQLHMEKGLSPLYIMDGARVKQVLQNLISNAIKFTKSGTITMTVSTSAHSSGGDAHDLVFTVEDTGIGIAQGDQAAIRAFFEQYDDKTSQHYAGIGLGLTLCGRLVNMMGGTLEFESTPGVGSRFTFHLPNVNVASDFQRAEKAKRTAVSQSSSARLLVVDDMDLIIEVFRDFFKDSAVEILAASNGEEALVIAEEQQPGMIFMDMNLMGMDGRETTEKLRSNPRCSSIPVVAMTGNLMEEEEYRPLFDALLQKPFRLEALSEMVERFVDLNSMRGASPPEKPEPGAEDETAWLRPVWTSSLDELLRRANASGSLAAAQDLGEAMSREGAARNHAQLNDLGQKLIRYALEPNILGVDKLLNQLTGSTR